MNDPFLKETRVKTEADAMTNYVRRPPLPYAIGPVQEGGVVPHVFGD
ncbi:MAG: hypothetical protein ABSA12_07650 [Verrucomicrobiia bacterium]